MGSIVGLNKYQYYFGVPYNYYDYNIMGRKPYSNYLGRPKRSNCRATAVYMPESILHRCKPAIQMRVGVIGNRIPCYMDQLLYLLVE